MQVSAKLIVITNTDSNEVLLDKVVLPCGAVESIGGKRMVKVVEGGSEGFVVELHNSCQCNTMAETNLKSERPGSTKTHAST